MKLLMAAVLLDLATFAALPEPVRAMAESNPLASSIGAALVLKVASLAAFLVLASRITTRSRSTAVALYAGIALIGAASNLRGLA